MKLRETLTDEQKAMEEGNTAYLQEMSQYRRLEQVKFQVDSIESDIAGVKRELTNIKQAVGANALILGAIVLVYALTIGGYMYSQSNAIGAAFTTVGFGALWVIMFPFLIKLLVKFIKSIILSFENQEGKMMENYRNGKKTASVRLYDLENEYKMLVEERDKLQKICNERRKDWSSLS